MAPPKREAAAPKEEKELSAKDQRELRNISKLFDDKKYKKALKDADQFLKHHPNNVDVQCFRSLIVYNLGRKEEAHTNAKNVLRYNMSSFTAWHTLGFLHRSDKNYGEALKCFRNAHKHNKDSVQILKDLSIIQVYQRDLVGLKETYSTLLSMQSQYKGHWIGLIVTNHLLGAFHAAVKILDNFMVVLDDKDATPMRFTELIMYKGMLLEEAGEYDAVLSLLRNHEHKLLDKTAVKMQMGECLLKKREFSAAEAIFRGLLRGNSENVHYHRKLWEARGLPSLDAPRTPEQNAALTALYQELAAIHPSSQMVQKLPLIFLEGSEFRSAVVAFSRHFLRKGIPSLFGNLKSLYNQPAKVAIIEQVFTAHITSLEAEGTLHNHAEQESPSTTLWCRYFLAQHFDRVGNHDAAMAQVDAAIKHTPTSVDIYVIKAKLLKHAGDLRTASSEYERARKLDLADRYLNTRSAKYALANDEREKAEEIFTHVIDKSDTVMFNISEFQCMWYETALGQSFMRTGDYNKALKTLYLVEKHFNEFIDDQFDFHHHIQKKLTMRAYVSFMRWEDSVFKNKPFQDAAKLIIKIYLILLKKPFVVPTTQQAPLVMEPKKKAAAAEGDTPKEKDEDPNGDKLATVADVLVPATKFLKSLLKYTPESTDALLLSCAIYLEKRKYLMLCILKEPVKLAVENERETLLGSSTLVQFNDNFVNANKQSIAHKFVAAESLLMVDSVANKDQALALMLDVTGEGSWTTCQDNLSRVVDLFGADIAQRFKDQCAIRFPHANCFQAPYVPAPIVPEVEIENGQTKTVTNGV
eukprot:gene19469-23316_t